MNPEPLVGEIVDPEERPSVPWSTKVDPQILAALEGLKKALLVLAGVVAVAALCLVIVLGLAVAAAGPRPPRA
jgi:hypothetical protein